MREFDFAANQRAVEGTLDEDEVRIEEKRADQSLQMARVGVGGVAIEKANDVGLGHGERAPHGIALAERRPGLGERGILLDHARADRSATLAVPSLEAASMTTVSSISPACAAGPTVCLSTLSIVAAHSLVGITTAIAVSPLSAFRRSRGKSVAS